MAKGSAMGIWRGRKGSTVFYYNRNSNNAQKQAMRERVYEISNPQSNSQVSQRMKLLPAQRLQQQLLSVLKRSWQGVEYGGRSLSQFMKYALKMTEGYPFVDKDDDRAIPGTYIIAKGTIPQVYTTVQDIDQHYTSLSGFNDNPQETTWGSVCERIISNGEAESGDQITFVLCLTDAANTSAAPTARYIWHVRSVIVDENSTQMIADIYANWPFTLGGYIEESSQRDILGLTAKNDLNIAASAVVISRQASTPMRSTAQLTVNENLLSYWFTQTRRSTARRSYQNQGGALSTNWPVDPDEEGGGGGGSTVIDGTFEITGLTGTKASCNGKLARVRVNTDTGVVVAVYVIPEESGVIGTNILVDNATGKAMKYTSEMQDVGLLPSEVTALASLPTIAV